MSGISGTSSSTDSTAASASSAADVGTDLAPITFPGIASGINYNSVITKLTSLTLAPKTEYEQQITQFNAKNAEVVKINGLLSSVQSALTVLSNRQTFDSYLGTSTDPTDATATQIAGQQAAPGAYQIEATQTATSTQITSKGSVGVAINPNIALSCTATTITPTNGTTGSAGSITIDGVSVKYDVTSQSLNTIISNIASALSSVDPGFHISLTSTGLVSITSTDQQISIGSPADSGNLASVLKLDTAGINNSVPPYGVQSAGPIGGVNATTTLSASDNAGFASAVTAGTFTINGVQIAVNPTTDTVDTVLQKINASTAGVVAAYNQESGAITLTDSATGPQSIVVGASGDTSNFLKLAGLTQSSGATTSVGQQAYVSVLSASGSLQTIYSSSNSVAGAIPGMDVNVVGNTTIPFTINVALNAQPAINAIQNFISVYNAAVSEIDAATAPPVVQQSASSSTQETSSSSVIGAGGILFGDQTVELIGSQLTNLVSNLIDSGSNTYNSLTSVGVSLDSSYTSQQANTDANGAKLDADAGALSSTTVDGTDGQLQALDVSQFTAALSADPQAVLNLFSSGTVSDVNSSIAPQDLPQGLTFQLGAYLTGITGYPTDLVQGIVGSIPATSLLQGDENTFTSEISNLNQSIKDVQDKANNQANQLRAQATASESLIAKYQAEQTYVNQLSSSSS